MLSRAPLPMPVETAGRLSSGTSPGPQLSRPPGDPEVRDSPRSSIAWPPGKRFSETFFLLGMRRIGSQRRNRPGLGTQSLRCGGQNLRKGKPELPARVCSVVLTTNDLPPDRSEFSLGRKNRSPVLPRPHRTRRSSSRSGFESTGIARYEKSYRARWSAAYARAQKPGALLWDRLQVKQIRSRSISSRCSIRSRRLACCMYIRKP